MNIYEFEEIVAVVALIVIALLGVYWFVQWLRRGSKRDGGDMAGGTGDTYAPQNDDSGDDDY